MRQDAMRDVCQEVRAIMKTYREQEERDAIGTPGGIEHLGDVWRLLHRWDDMLSVPPDPIETFRTLRCSRFHMTQADQQQPLWMIPGATVENEAEYPLLTLSVTPWRDSPPEDTSPELNAVMAFAIANGCDRVLFDTDGPELRGFPTFDEETGESPC